MTGVQTCALPIFRRAIGGEGVCSESLRYAVSDRNVPPELLRRLISILIVTIRFDRREAERVRAPIENADDRLDAVHH